MFREIFLNFAKFRETRNQNLGKIFAISRNTKPKLGAHFCYFVRIKSLHRTYSLLICNVLYNCTYLSVVTFDRQGRVRSYLCSFFVPNFHISFLRIRSRIWTSKSGPEKSCPVPQHCCQVWATCLWLLQVHAGSWAAGWPTVGRGQHDIKHFHYTQQTVDDAYSTVRQFTMVDMC